MTLRITGDIHDAIPQIHAHLDALEGSVALGLTAVDAFSASEPSDGIQWTFNNPNAVNNSTDLVGRHTVTHFDSSLADPLFAIQTSHYDELFAWKGQNQFGGLTAAKQSFMNFDYRQYSPAAGQGFIQANQIWKYGMGDAFISSDAIRTWGGVDKQGDEGTSYRTMHMTHGEHIVTATITGIVPQSTINTTLVQDVLKSKTAQAVNVNDAGDLAPGDWVVIDRGVPFVSDLDMEAVKVISVGSAVTPIVPTDIAGCKLWFKANSLALSDNDPVSTWTDSSGNANNATQTGTLRPIYKASIINGLPVVRFDGVDDFMTFTPVTTLRTVFVVIKHADGSQDNPPILGHPSAFNFAGGTGTALIDTTFSLVDGVYIDGAAVTPAAAAKPTTFKIICLTTSANASAEYITNDRNVGGRCWDGDYAEIIAYDTVLSTSDRQGVEAYLSDKYAITVSAPASFTAVFRANHNSGATVTPATVLTLSSGYQFGEMRPIINRSATPVSAGTATVPVFEGLEVVGTGTSFSNGMVGGDSILPGYFTFIVDDFEGSTPTGGSFFHSNGTELKNYYPISAVASATSLNIVRRSAAYTIGYKGKAVGVDSDYEVWPGARMLTFDYPANPTDWSNTIVLETNTFDWNIGDVVECAFSVNNAWVGELMRMTPIVQGGDYYSGYSLVNYGCVAVQAAFTASANQAFLWPGNPTGPVGFETGLSLSGVGTGIKLYCKDQAVEINASAGLNADINWIPNAARIGYGSEALYINFRSAVAPNPATQTLGILYSLVESGVALPKLRYTGNLELFNSSTGEEPFLRFKDAGSSITLQPAYPITGGPYAIGVPALAGTVALTGAANASWFQATEFRVGGTKVVGGRGAALTAADASAINSGDGTTDTVIANMRTRINELEARLGSATGHGLFT